jgi:hypothetical protein
MIAKIGLEFGSNAILRKYRIRKQFATVGTIQRWLQRWLPLTPFLAFNLMFVAVFFSVIKVFLRM